MSLKGFHIVLISLSSILALFFGGWSLRAYTVTRSGAHLALALFSLMLAAALVIYVIWFARKVRSRDEEDRQRRKVIRPLVLASAAWLVSARPAAACSVCFGQAEGPMIDAARLGVWLLFGLVLAIQFAFVLFFVQLRKRAKDHRERNPFTG